MPIETICQGCARKLRVDDQYAGKQARCPQCGMIYTVPGEPVGAELADNSAAGPVATNTEPADTQWQLRIPDGRIFGPVPKSELDQWVREGRVTAECHVLKQGTQIWQPADTLYPELSPQAAKPPLGKASVGANPFAEDAAAQPYASPQVANQYMHLQPHRGTLILILAILGWAICFVFAPFAWAMGSSDLRAMREGQMDPRGMGMTQAGMILGMIQTILFLLVVAFFIVMAVVNG